MFSTKKVNTETLNLVVTVVYGLCCPHSLPQQPTLGSAPSPPLSTARAAHKSSLPFNPYYMMPRSPVPVIASPSDWNSSNIRQSAVTDAGVPTHVAKQM